jgi:tRNA(Ile)-lysidine synthase
VSSRADDAGTVVLDRIIPALDRLPGVRRYWVAFSGGLDSTVLLHAMASLRPRLGAALCAVHVNHGLQAAAADWAHQCQDACDGLGIPLRGFSVDARPADGESPEAAARHARYDALRGLMEAGDCLLTAHHQDDQAETVLLQLLRGSGVAGLAAMPPLTPFAAGWHARPLLDLTRNELQAYAAAHALRWIDDPSNFDTGLRRNYLRHEILPRLRRQWPAFARTLSRSAAHNAETARLLDEIGAEDLAAVAGPKAATLSIDALMQLSPERLNNVVRYWLRTLELPLPSTAHLERLHEDILKAAQDSAPLLAWPGAEVRRYRSLLYAMWPLPPHDAQRVVPWDLDAPLDLPTCGGRLGARHVAGHGIRRVLLRDRPVTVRFRRGGEHCRPAGRGHTHELRKLLQESAVPPWLRERVPLLYVGEDLAAVADLFTCEGFQAGVGEAGVELEWTFQALAPEERSRNG